MGLIPRFLILAVSFMTTSCVTPSPLIFEEEGVAPLSKSGCPDLTGHYLNLVDNRKGITFYALGGLRDQAYLTIATYDPPAAKKKVARLYDPRTGMDTKVFRMEDSTTSTVRVEQNAEHVTMVLQDIDGNKWARQTIQLSSFPDVGCRDGALVLRWRQYSAGAEMAPSNQHYGEIILNKDADGSILYSNWSRSRQYSNLLRAPSPGMGKQMQTWRVKPVPQ